MGNVPVTISVNRSANNGGVYIGLDKLPDEYGDDYFGSITVNLPVVGKSGFCTYPLFLFNMTVLREYAPEEVDAYLTALEGEV